METLNTKKIIIIFSVLLTIVLSAVLIAFTTGNVKTPNISDPDGIFYQRLDNDGNVLYTITNEEVFNTIKSQNGISQLLLLADSQILSDYMSQVTDDEIADKIKQLKYGTSDDDTIASLDADQIQKAEDQFNQAMILAGYADNAEDYARILIAREKYVLQAIDSNGEITENDVADAFVNDYFSDVQAIKIRFTSKDDAENVMHMYNMVSTASKTLASYNGYVFQKENLTDPNGDVVEAYIPVEAYYFDTDNNILNMDGNTVYTYDSDNDNYTNSDNEEFTLSSGSLIDADTNVVIDSSILFADKDSAETYFDANTQYFTVSKTDPFDEDETINIYDDQGNLAFYKDSDGKIYDATNDQDVTDTTDLYVNKVYKNIDDVDSFTLNDTTPLTDQQILDIYIQMYNYVYGEYRDTLPENARDIDLVDLNNPDLQFNYDDVKASSSELATYMFKTLSSINDTTYSTDPQALKNGSDDQYFMIYKLTSPTKLDLADICLTAVKDHLNLPTQVGGDIELPTTGAYGATITWSSSDNSIIDSTGAFTRPDQDTQIGLTWSIKVLGLTKSGIITVTALADGDTVQPDASDWTPATIRSLINDDTVYDMLYNRLVNDMVYGDNASANIKSHMADLRKDLGFKIYDEFLGYDYTSYDSSYVYKNNGDSTLIASFDSTLTNPDTGLNISSDDLFKYSVEKDAGLYTIYASEFKELLNSTFYTAVFGTQTDLNKNTSARMDDMTTTVAKTKSNYSGLEKLYQQYNMTFPYSSYREYIHKQYKVTTEAGLLQYFVTGVLQPYLIMETMDDYDIANKVYPVVEDYYNNYFSLSVNHLLIYVDFDEDGTPDNYQDYYDSLTTDQQSAWDSALASLEQEIRGYSSEFSTLVSEYDNAERDDATWGQYKQMGIMILTESLDPKDSQNASQTHSLTYSGDYGTKDSYDPAFTDALISMYQTYQEPIHQNDSAMYSDNLVETQFGLHYIKVTKGDDFDKPTAKFPTDDTTDTSIYSAAALNDNDMPSIDQLNLYISYKFYSLVYDLTDTEAETKYNITVPNIPTSVMNSLDTYAGDIVNNIYVIGTVNIAMADRLVDGSLAADNPLVSMTNADFLASLSTLSDTYYHSVLDQYLDYTAQ